jgi:isopentenyl phosphate kinase
MTILSTEMIFAYLAPVLMPARIILAGILDGVFTGDPLKESSARLIREITPASFSQIESQLRGSHGYDVTGGMIAKVKSMVALVEREPAIRVHIISAMREGLIEQVLTQEDFDAGTAIHA